MKKIKPQLKILFTYLILILVGFCLLILPFSTKINVSCFDIFFTSISTVTITGLDPIGMYDTFTLFGKIVIAILIQLGGLSITTIQVFLLTIIGAKISYRSKELVKENLNVNHRVGIIKTIKRIVTITLIIELIGLLLFIPFFLINGYRFDKALAYSVFHTISAYNNAGFAFFNQNSLIIFSKDLYFNLITIMLVILGGIGTLVIYDISKNKRWKKFNFHTKIVLKMTLILLVISSILFFLLEDNASLMNSMFHAVSIRTAGFYSYNYLNAKTATLFMMIIFMFIGGAPASTASGIKITNVFTLFKAAQGKLTNKTPTYRKRKIPKEYIDKAYLVLILSLVITFVSVIIILIFENAELTLVIFEVFSAYSNTGLSLNLTSSLTIVSKIVLMFLMLIGRIGVITFASALIFSEQKYENIEYIDLEYLI